MERKTFSDIELFSKEKPVLVPLFSSERLKVLLLCLSPGLRVPPHHHAGFDVTLHPLKGKAILPVEGEKEITLVPNEILFLDGANTFSPHNPFDTNFSMLIHLVKR